MDCVTHNVRSALGDIFYLAVRAGWRLLGRRPSNRAFARFLADLSSCLSIFKQLPVYINSLLPSQTRKLGNFETTWPCAFHATQAPVSLFPCSPHHRAPGMEAESTSGGSKERPFFSSITSSIYRAYMYFFMRFLMQENEKRHESHAAFCWRMSV